MNPPEFLRLDVVAGSVLYAILGVAVLWLTFLVIDKVTPYDLWKEICEERNIALAIVIAGMFVALGLIVAAAIHG
jgi:putative membrane protein